MLLSKKSILWILSYRLILAFLTRNYQYPDEYWQGPEVAHKIYYGYGFLTWQWTQSQPLRNPIYPFLLTFLYPIAQLLNCDFLRTNGPHLIQALLSTLCDFYLIRILHYIYGKVTLLSVVVIFANFSYASFLSRTYANSFQTCLTVIAYYYWVTNSRQGLTNSKDIKNRLIVTINYVSRPTSVTLWALLWPYQLIKICKIYGIISKRVFLFVGKNVMNLLLMVASSMIVGSFYFGKFTITQFNFIKYNFIQKWSQLYGKQHTLYYFYKTIPFLINFTLIYTFISILMLFKNKKISNKQQSNKKQQHTDQIVKQIVYVSIIYLLFSSLSTHKQDRFILPILPFILIVTVYCLNLPNSPDIQIEKQTKQKTENSFITYITSPKLLKLMGIVVIIGNLIIFFIFSFYGKSDGISPWKHINQQMKIRKLKQNETLVIVMGESHFIPGYSYLHKNISYRIPDSSAPVMSTNSSQNKLLIEDPQRLYRILTTNNANNNKNEDMFTKPDFIISQGKYLRYTADIFVREGYRQTKFWRHCTLAQQIFLQYDSIHIFQNT